MWPNVQSVFETGWTTVRNWCPRTSVHQAGTRVKTWCLPPLLHKIFFCAREIGVAHSWAKLYVATTGDHAWCFNKTEESFFCVAFKESASLVFYIPAFFFFISSMKKISNVEPRGCVSNGANFHLFSFFPLSFSFEDVWNMNCIGMDGRYEWVIDVWFYYLKMINEKIVCSYWYLWNYIIIFFRHELQHIYTNNYAIKENLVSIRIFHVIIWE